MNVEVTGPENEDFEFSWHGKSAVGEKLFQKIIVAKLAMAFTVVKTIYVFFVKHMYML